MKTQCSKKRGGLSFISLRFAKYLTGVQGFLCGSAGKESDCDTGDLGSIPGLGRSPGKGKGYPLQYFGLESSMDCTVHGVAELNVTELLSLSLMYTCGMNGFTHIFIHLFNNIY